MCIKVRACPPANIHRSSGAGSEKSARAAHIFRDSTTKFTEKVARQTPSPCAPWFNCIVSNADRDGARTIEASSRSPKFHRSFGKPRHNVCRFAVCLNTQASPRARYSDAADPVAGSGFVAVSVASDGEFDGAGVVAEFAASRPGFFTGGTFNPSRSARVSRSV